MIITKKDLIERLKCYDAKEKLLVLFWARDEFEHDRELTTKEWNNVLSEVDEEGAEQEIVDQICEATARLVAEEEEE